MIRWQYGFHTVVGEFETSFQLIKLNMETQFGSFANKVLQLVATNTETDFSPKQAEPSTVKGLLPGKQHPFWRYKVEEAKKYVK